MLHLKNEQLDNLRRALISVEQAQEALATAASALRQNVDDELTESALRLEGEACILSVYLQREVRKCRRVESHAIVG